MNATILHTLAVALWIMAPVLLAGLGHIAVIRLRLFPALAAIPLDGGIALRGRRLFGENKTLRGPAVMSGGTAICVFLETVLAPSTSARELAAAFQLAHPLVWGALAGAGYSAGELPNSFAKRRLGVAAGAISTGWSRPIFWTVDQIDSVVGVVIFLLPVWTPTWPVVLALIGLTLAVHPLVALLMVGLGLKTRVG